MMATLDMEDRKRPLDLDSLNNPSTASKRPHIDRSSSSFVSNGPTAGKRDLEEIANEDDESTPAYKGLEAFRKEAIYRLMREAKRELHRSEERVKQLQDAVDAMNERCAAFNRFWDTLVEDVRLLVNEENLSSEHKSALFDAIPLTSRKPAISAFSESIQERNTSLKAVLSRIASLGSKSTPEIDQLQARCHRLGEESASLRSQLTLAINDKETLTEELSRTSDHVRRIEKKLDRMHSTTVKASERPGEQAEEEAEQAKVEAANAEKEAALQRKERAEGEIQGENGTSPASRTNGTASNEELEDYKKLAEMRLDECDRWKREVVAIRQEIEGQEQRMQKDIDGLLLQSPIYRNLHSHHEQRVEEIARINALNQRIEEENLELRERRAEFEVAAKAEADAQVNKLRSTIKTHEADLARLRAQRDELNVDLAEKKQRESLRYSQIDEMKALVQSKDARIAAMKSEVRRLQLTFAANTGDEKLRERLTTAGQTGEEEEDVKIIEALQDRLKLAEETSSNLKRQFEARSSSTSEQDLSNKVVALQAELDQLSSILQEATSDQDPSSESVKMKLISQSEEIQKLKRELATAQESTNALCDELDKIGEAYNQSQKVATERVVEVGRMEEHLSRVTKEKLKADNRYFGAMREKDALETERKAIARTLEYQGKVIEKFKEVEMTLRKEWQQSEAEITSYKTVIKVQNGELQNREHSLKREQMIQENLVKAKQEAEDMCRKRNAEFVEESTLRQEVQEKCDKLQRELDRCKKQLATSGGSLSKKKSGGSGGDDVQIEYLNSLLRCSACKDRYRDRIITRCLHTFCQDCVDARIQTRQRKCPHCGLGFSTSDVQTLYLQ